MIAYVLISDSLTPKGRGMSPNSLRGDRHRTRCGCLLAGDGFFSAEQRRAIVLSLSRKAESDVDGGGDSMGLIAIPSL